MQVQSLSVVVPNKQCINHCPFCVSRMHANDYENRMDIDHPLYDLYVQEYLKCMRYAADQECRTAILTGTSEPQQNKVFLNTFALLHRQLGNPFVNLEMQTTGMMLQDNPNYLRFLRNFVGVGTMALSVSSLDDAENNKVLGSYNLELPRLVGQMKEFGFVVRMCLNMTSLLLPRTLGTWEDAFGWLKAAGADQVTLRKMYAAPDTAQGSWLKDHRIPLETCERLEAFLEQHDEAGKTMYGARAVDVDGMSVVYDRDCMGKNPETDVLKFLVLRPDCHLYSQWDTPASLVL